MKKIYNSDGTIVQAKNISPYLIDAHNIWIESRPKPICDVQPIIAGGKPVEGGHLIFTEEEKNEFIKIEPKSAKYIVPFLSGDDFLYNKTRFCLWLKDVSPSDLRTMSHVMNRIKLVKEFRQNSKKEATRKCADTPHLFMEIKKIENDYLIIPLNTSSDRQYIPIAFMSKNTVPSNLVSFIPNANLYMFGILTSSVHMAWMRAVCGRLGNGYRYSNSIVYNNFPWPQTKPPLHIGEGAACRQAGRGEVSSLIEKTAQAILDARALYPDCSLADLYDETTMPPELRKAHQANDKAVMAAYGFDPKMTESEIVSELFKMYEEMVRK